jgi:hypothetical protein
MDVHILGGGGGGDTFHGLVGGGLAAGSVSRPWNIHHTHTGSWLIAPYSN